MENCIFKYFFPITLLYQRPCSYYFLLFLEDTTLPIHTYDPADTLQLHNFLFKNIGSSHAVCYLMYFL